MKGIYKITNKLNNKIYIGQSNNIERRIAEHKRKRKVPIDMYINVLGVENFDFEIIEEADDLDIREKYYIEKFNSCENGYNIRKSGPESQVGEDNGRSKLSEEDIIYIRQAYANHYKQKDTYKLFEDKISFSQFQAIWQGRSWSHIMPDVFTLENKKYYVKEKDKKTVILSKEDVLRYRKYYVNHTAKETYCLCLKEKGNVIKERTFQKILIGDVRLNSIYNEIPIYKKQQKVWLINNEPVSTIPESGE